MNIPDRQHFLLLPEDLHDLEFKFTKDCHACMVSGPNARELVPGPFWTSDPMPLGTHAAVGDPILSSG
ncbi:hypothetical protein GCM10027030_30560 [Luteococcus sediminum]